ncbi:MAG: hypothetical protein H6732_00055 [Alphaproteobacteria bacterium]|nr:hypothetical protein [Alphaproteobacteria bacterium]
MRSVALPLLALAVGCAPAPDAACTPGEAGCPVSDTDDGPVDTDDSPVDTDDGSVDTDAPDDTGPTAPVIRTCTELGITPTSLDAAGPDAQGRFLAWGAFPTDDGTLSASCGGAPGPQAVLTFAVPTSGTWHFTTDGAGTTTEATISLRSACDDLAELACDAQGAGALSSTLVHEAMAGEVLTVLVQGGSPGRTWQLTAAPVGREAAVGEACGEAAPCASGSACLPGDAPVCVAFEAPEVSTHTARYVANDEVLHTITGTDADGDVERLWILRVDHVEGHVWGDDPGETPVLVETADLVQADGRFTFTWQQYVHGFLSSPQYVAAVTLGVEDHAGHRTILPSLALPVEPEATTVAAGETCSADGYPIRCAKGSTCQDLGQGPVCADPLPPVLTSAELVLRDDRDFAVRVQGTDADLDTSGMRLVFDMVDGGQRKLNSVYFTDDATTWTGSAFVATRKATVSASWGEVAQVTVKLFDGAGLESDTVTLPWTEVPRGVLAEGEACTPDDDLAACDTGMVCGPALQGGTACKQPTAPHVFAVDFKPSVIWPFPSTDVRVDGADLDGDVKMVTLTFSNASGRTTQYLPANRMVPSPRGKAFFRGTGPLEDFDPAPFSHVEVDLADDEGLRSAPLTVQLALPLPEGEGCERTDVSTICDLEAELTCGLSGVCEQNEAPRIVTAVAHRLGDKDVAVELTVADTNADAFDLRVEVQRDGEPFTLRGAYQTFPEPVYGELQATRTVSFPSLAQGDEALVLRLTPRDLPGLLGAPVDVVVPPLAQTGETCSGDDTVDRCVAGSSCDAGTCVEHDPTLDAFALTFPSPGRAAVFTLTGVDPDHDLDDVFVHGADADGTAWTHEAKVGRSYGDQVEVTWSGDTYTAVVRVPGWGGTETTDLLSATAWVGDARDALSPTADVVIPATRNLDEACDVTGSSSRCQAGLACDAGTCVVDAFDACGGLEVGDLAADGTAVEGTLRYAVDLDGLPSLAEPTCKYAYSPARGGEAAVVWTAPQTGTVDVWVEVPTGTDLGVFVTSGQCVDPDAALTCAQRGEHTTVDVTAGETLYFTLDAFSGVTRSGTLVVGYLD